MFSIVSRKVAFIPTHKGMWFSAPKTYKMSPEEKLIKDIEKGTRYDLEYIDDDGKESVMRQNKTGEYILVENVLEIIRHRFYNDVP